MAETWGQRGRLPSPPSIILASFHFEIVFPVGITPQSDQKWKYCDKRCNFEDTDSKHSDSKHSSRHSKGLFIWAKVIPVNERTFRQVYERDLALLRK